jgi:hypothetical protein
MSGLLFALHLLLIPIPLSLASTLNQILAFAFSRFRFFDHGSISDSAPIAISGSLSGHIVKYDSHFRLPDCRGTILFIDTPLDLFRLFGSFSSMPSTTSFSSALTA